MAAAKGIKELEDELNKLMQGSVEEEESEQVETEVVEKDSFISDRPKKDQPEEAPLSKEEESWKKRYGDLRRHSQKQKEEFENRLAQLEKSKAPNNEPPTNPDEVKAWVEKYPQVAAIIQALAEDKAKKLYGDDIQSLKKETEKEKKSRELAKIYKAHDDFDDIKDDDKFHDWAESQPVFIQDFVYKGSADQVIWAVNKYKESLETRPNMDKEAAKTIGKTTKTSPSTGDGKRRFLESEVEEMPMSEYVELQEEIQAAMREGRFVYDISGAAR